METKVQFWVKQLHPVQARVPNVQSLRYWGNCLKVQWRRSFEKLHGNLLRLLEIETQPTALEALFQYYDSPMRCFTFRDFQMASTLEEYERLLGLPLMESPHYFHQAQPPSWAIVARLLRVSEAKMNRNGLEGVPRVYIEERLFQFQEEQDWAVVIDILGLLLYGVVLFPYVEDYVDLVAIELFLGKRDSGENSTWPFWPTLTTRSITAANGRLEISDVAPPTLLMVNRSPLSMQKKDHLPDRRFQVELG
ncbi:hypothetical protein CR513_04292, partial [Mucuna pruriens]